VLVSVVLVVVETWSDRQKGQVMRGGALDGDGGGVALMGVLYLRRQVERAVATGRAALSAKL